MCLSSSSSINTINGPRQYNEMAIKIDQFQVDILNIYNMENMLMWRCTIDLQSLHPFLYSWFWRMVHCIWIMNVFISGSAHRRSINRCTGTSNLWRYSFEKMRLRKLWMIAIDLLRINIKRIYDHDQSAGQPWSYTAEQSTFCSNDLIVFHFFFSRK